MNLYFLSLLVSLGLMTGCASDDWGSFSSNESTTTSVDTNAIDAANATQQRINDQMAVDAANAAATEQNNAAVAAAQQTENNANAEFNQNGLH